MINKGLDMKKSVFGMIGILAVTGGYGLVAANRCATPCKSLAGATGASSCSSPTATPACEAPHGKIAGRFDPAMSSVCRFACATKLKYDPRNVLPQPGAKAGKLTQCPVSGVVFALDPGRPHVRIANQDYVTCCDRCAQKLKRNPRRYLKV